MQNLPHHYKVTSQVETTGVVSMETVNAPKLLTTAPVEFGGPGGEWSPETLLVSAVASCFLLTFRAVARASKLEWHALSCDVCGVLERVGKTTQFTEFHITAHLTTTDEEDLQKMERLLEKAEGSCLISCSLKADTTLKTEVSSVSLSNS